MGFGSFRNSEVKMDTMGHNRVNGFSQRIFTMIDHPSIEEWCEWLKLKIDSGNLGENF